MNLDIRPIERPGDKPGQRFAMTPPSKVVDGQEQINFHILLETIAVVVSSFTWEKVERETVSEGKCWKIWARDNSYCLNFMAKDGYLEVRAETSGLDLIDLLQLTQRQIDDEIAMGKGDEWATSARSVEKVEVPKCFEEKVSASINTMTVGKLAAKTPPPMPNGTYCIVNQRRSKK